MRNAFFSWAKKSNGLGFYLVKYQIKCSWYTEQSLPAHQPPGATNLPSMTNTAFKTFASWAILCQSTCLLWSRRVTFSYISCIYGAQIFMNDDKKKPFQIEANFTVSPSPLSHPSPSPTPLPCALLIQICGNKPCAHPSEWFLSRIQSRHPEGLLLYWYKDHHLFSQIEDVCFAKWKGKEKKGYERNIWPNMKWLTSSQVNVLLFCVSFNFISFNPCDCQHLVSYFTP